MIQILESIIYVISSILLILSFIKVKKSNEELNLVNWIFITLVIFFCYNSFITYILNLLNIPIYLFILIIINFVISIILIKQKKQKYIFNKKDLVAPIVLFVLSLAVMLIRFGIPFSIKYETCDPGVHFWTAKEFQENSALLNRVKDKTVVNFETRQTASYTNVGLFFKIVVPFTGKFKLYIPYILFDIYMLYMAAMLFYILITKKKKHIILGLILSALYVLGYPLNNMIFGFFYSGHAVTIISLILILINYYKDEKFNKKIFLSIMSITCFGLFFTYYFYVPVVFISLALYIFIKNRKNFLILNYLLDNLIIFLPACLFGFLYYILPNIGNPDTSISTQINLNGYYYNNIISNVILFIPLIIISYIINFKNKKLQLEHITLIILTIFMIIVTAMMFKHTAVGYYLSKTYYLLWLIIYAIISKLMLENFEKNKLQIITYISFIFLIIILNATKIEKKIADLEEWNMNKATVSNLFEIYDYNLDRIINEEADFNTKELKMLNEVYKMKPQDLQTNAYYNHTDRKTWLAAWFRTKKITDTTENKLFDSIVPKDFIDPYGIYLGRFEYMSEKHDYSIINDSNYNWFLLFYNKTKQNSINQSAGYIPEGKNEYDLLDRNTCQNCKFYDFEDGVLIVK